jgi:para-nitrobenzyl esterase
MVLDGAATPPGCWAGDEPYAALVTEIATPCGRLAGVMLELDGRVVNVFRGIPYAHAMRFAPPTRAESWEGTQLATSFGPAAPQPIGGPLDGLVPGSFRGPTDEATCLSLNVYADARAHSDKRPVLVWFPGGAFTTGAASQPVYDGRRFCVEENVVLVTCNYRLGALGFLDARPAGGTTNCGLRDAIAALEWVRDNISAFGGDPDRVTVFGESAGGGMVLHLCASPPARGLFGAAIVQSGATFNTLDEASAATVRGALLAELGSNDPAALCEVPLIPTIGMMPFHPMVDDDVLPVPPVEALARGSFAGKQLVVGTTTDEMRLFVDTSGPPPERERLVKRVARYIGVEPERAATIVDGYEAALRTNDTHEIWATLFSDVEMQVPAAAVRDAHAPHGRVYAYQFGWRARNPALGACHGIDIPFTFGNFVDGWDDFVGADGGAHALSHTMRRAWADLARDGDPGWPEAPASLCFERHPGVSDDPLRARLSLLAP